MSLIEELRNKADAIKRQRQVEREHVAFRMVSKRDSTFMDDARFIAAMTAGRRVRV